MTGPVWSFTVAFLKLVPRSTWVALAIASAVTGFHQWSPSLSTGLALTMGVLFVVHAVALTIHELGPLLAGCILGFRFLEIRIGTYGIRRGAHGRLEPYRVSKAHFESGHVRGENRRKESLKSRLIVLYAAGMVLNVLCLLATATYLISASSDLNATSFVLIGFAIANGRVIHGSLHHPKGDAAYIRGIWNEDKTGRAVITHHRLDALLATDSLDELSEDLLEAASPRTLLKLYGRLLERNDKVGAARVANATISKAVDNQIRFLIALAWTAAFQNRDIDSAHSHLPAREAVSDEDRVSWFQTATLIALVESRFSDGLRLAEEALANEALNESTREWFTYATKSARRRGGTSSPADEVVGG